MSEADEDLMFESFEALYIYAFVLDIDTSVPLHTLIARTHKDNYGTSWGLGVWPGREKTHPTLVPKRDESPESPPDNDEIMRAMWFRVAFGSDLTPSFFGENAPQPRAVSIWNENRKINADVSAEIHLLPSGIATMSVCLTIGAESILSGKDVVETLQRLPRWNTKHFTLASASADNAAAQSPSSKERGINDGGIELFKVFLESRKNFVESLRNAIDTTLTLHTGRENKDAKVAVADASVCSDIYAAADPQLPYFVGVGALHGRVPAAPFDFMESMDSRKSSSVKHFRALQMALRAFTPSAFESAGQKRLYPQETGSVAEHPLRNRVWNDYTWVTMTRRTALLLSYANETRPGEIAAEVLSIIRSGLLDLVHMGKGRWHALLLLNWQLDNLVSGVRTTTLGDHRQLDKLVDLRRRYALLLNSPMTYRFEGGSFTDLAEDARRFLLIDRLEEALAAKFKQVERMHEEHAQARALENLDLGVE